MTRLTCFLGRQYAGKNRQRESTKIQSVETAGRAKQPWQGPAKPEAPPQEETILISSGAHSMFWHFSLVQCVIQEEEVSSESLGLPWRSCKNSKAWSKKTTKTWAITGAPGLSVWRWRKQSVKDGGRGLSIVPWQLPTQAVTMKVFRTPGFWVHGECDN